MTVSFADLIINGIYSFFFCWSAHASGHFFHGFIKPSELDSRQLWTTYRVQSVTVQSGAARVMKKGGCDLLKQ
ncbi:uncharacterized protein V6R79_001103 [Siganus canaliculatus]